MLRVSDELGRKHARDFGKESCKVLEWNEDGVQRLILNVRGSHFTQYLGIPEDHPLAGFNCEELPIRCHGGLTFSDEGDDKYYPKGFYWYGWDYAHAGDFITAGANDLITTSGLFSLNGDKDWTLKEVIEDGYQAFYDFKVLKELAEKIANKVSKRNKEE
jgi:hypothetical protein